MTPEAVLEQMKIAAGKVLGVSSAVVFVTWYSKTLQNSKALLSTYGDNMPYVECTYNGDTAEMYVDVYSKVENHIVKL